MARFIYSTKYMLFIMNATIRQLGSSVFVSATIRQWGSSVFLSATIRQWDSSVFVSATIRHARKSRIMHTSLLDLKLYVAERLEYVSLMQVDDTLYHFASGVTTGAAEQGAGGGGGFSQSSPFSSPIFF